MQLDRFHGVERYIRSQETRKYHTREQRLKALNNLVANAWADPVDAKAMFHIPPLDDDADVILYNAIDELEERSLGKIGAYVATISGGSYGLRDFPDGKPGIWFSVNYGLYSGYCALIAFTSNEAEEFTVKNNINDIRQIDGRECVIVDEGGIVHFIGMFQSKGLSHG